MKLSFTAYSFATGAVLLVPYISSKPPVLLHDELEQHIPQVPLNSTTLRPYPGTDTSIGTWVCAVASHGKTDPPSIVPVFCLFIATITFFFNYQHHHIFH